MRRLNIEKKEFIFNHIKCILPAILYAVCSILYPNFIRLIIDEGVMDINMTKTGFYCIQLLIVGLITGISDYYYNLLYDEFYLKVSTDIKNRLFKNVLNASNEFLTSAKAGEIYTCLSRDISSITMILTRDLPNLLINIIILIGASICIIYYYKIFGVMIISCGIIFVFYQKRIGKVLQIESEKTRNAVGDEASFCTASLSNLENIQLSGYTETISKKYEMYSKETWINCLKHDSALYKSFAMNFIVDMFIIVFVLLVGGFQIESGKLQVGVLLSIILYTQKVVSPMKMIARLYVEIKDIHPVLKKVNDLLDGVQIVNDSNEFLQEEIARINFRNIWFYYEKQEKYILKKFNFEISNTDIVGIVGGNGKGKTTLIRLLGKMCVPQKGEILINNQYNIQNISVNSIHEQISFFTQNIFLENGTLREVINPLQREIGDFEIIEILKNLNLDFAKFGESLDFTIAENGNNISGGEKQKIALARLIIENKKWIVLDEPTSAMDAISERIVCIYMKKFFNNRTALIITHRTAILEICTKTIDFNKLGENRDEYFKECEN